MTFELSVWPKLANSNYELDWTTMCFGNWRIFAIKRALANNGFGVLQRVTAAAGPKILWFEWIRLHIALYIRAYRCDGFTVPSSDRIDSVNGLNNGNDDVNTIHYIYGVGRGRFGRLNDTPNICFRSKLLWIR